MTVKFSDRRKFDVFIGDDKYKWKAIHHVDTDLLKLPQFLRFDEVELYYCYASNKLIQQKCHSVEYYLLLLKEQLKDLNLISVTCAIKNAYVGNEIYQNDGRYFSSHSYLLDHFRNELLPLCGPSRVYSTNSILISIRKRVPAQM